MQLHLLELRFTLLGLGDDRVRDEPLQVLFEVGHLRVELLGLQVRKVKTPDQLEDDKARLMGDQSQLELTKQAGQFAGTPLMDPSKNPDLADQAGALAQAFLGGQQPPEE